MNLDNLKTPSDKKFGLFFSMIFFLIFLYLYFIDLNNSGFYFLFGTILFFLISFLKPIILKPLNISWMYFGYLLGKFFNPIILGILFFFIVTPIALTMKIFLRDELKIKKNGLSSFWLISNKSENNSNFEKQF